MRKYFLTCMVTMLATTGVATADTIDAVTRVGDTLTSITVGAYTVTDADLGFGASDVTDGWVDNLEVLCCDDWSFNMTTDYTGMAAGGFSSINGGDVDFFLFESAGNDTIDITSVYSLDGGVTSATGLPITFAAGGPEDEPAGDYGMPGGTTEPGGETGQALAGIAFRTTDLLDDSGANLPETALILSTYISGGSGIDAVSYSVAIPEPATMSLLALGALGLIRRRRA